jgi:hypothetical protein
MLKYSLSGLAIWTFVVCACIASSEAPYAAPAIHPPAPAPPADATIELQMLAFERHARVDMILYGGRFGQLDRAQMRRELNAIAMSVKAGK